MSETVAGRDPSGQALVSDGAPANRHPPGFDPSRECEHHFAGWRDHDDGLGGEMICTRCGIGAMAYTLSLDF